jgi:pre-mRNA-splicing factor CDC5/CEF1
MRQQLRSQLAALPKPRNEFEIVLPDVPADDAGAGDDGQGDDDNEEEEEEGEGDGGDGSVVSARGSSATVEDAAEVEARRQEAARRRAEEEFRTRSLVLQRQLPRPVTVNVAAAEAAAAAAGAGAAALVQAEMLAMLRHDAAVFPPKGATHAPGRAPAGYDRLSRDELAEAEALVAAELRELSVEVDPTTYANLWAAAASDFVFVPATQQYGRASTASKTDRIASLQNELEVHGTPPRAPCTHAQTQHTNAHTRRHTQ